MAIREGRCPNCGSIVHLDNNAEKGHCLFCDAIFQSRTAFDIAADPKAHTFPNLPQPKYDGPDLQPSRSAVSAPDRQRAVQQQVKKAPPATPPAYVPKEPEKIPDFKMPLRTKIRILAVTLVVIALIAGISVPLIIRRDQHRAALYVSMAKIAPFPVQVGQAVEIRRLGNTDLLIAADQAVSETDMVLLFKRFCEQRAEIMQLDAADFAKVYRPVTVKLVTDQGGYLIQEPKSQAELDSGSAIVRLP